MRESDPEPPVAAPALEDRDVGPGLLLALLGQHAMRRLREAHARQGLSPRQFQLLDLVGARGPIGQRELGQAMETDPSVLVTLLNPLEAEGLLSRARDPEDRRCHRVSLSAKGRRRLIAAARAQRDAEQELFAGLSEPDRDQLDALLRTLRQSVSVECATAPGRECE